MERAHRHASELTKSSIDIDGDVEVIAAATDHLQVKLQCRPRSLRREQQALSEVGARMSHVSDAKDGRRLITLTVSSCVCKMGRMVHSQQTDGRERPLH